MNIDLNFFLSVIKKNVTKDTYFKKVLCKYFYHIYLETKLSIFAIFKLFIVFSQVFFYLYTQFNNVPYKMRSINLYN